MPLYGVDRDEVTVSGREAFEAELHATQVDSQYHAETIKDSDHAREKIQKAIDMGGRIHDRPLYVVKGGLKSLFDFPENGEVLHYHAARGLNRAECDAVFCIGAPHPKIEDLRRTAGLLAQDRDDLRVGGRSTRRGETRRIRLFIGNSTSSTTTAADEPC